MKKILGLDLGTNSIGWALIENDFDQKKGHIINLGSRIIPMSLDIMSNFESGQSHSQTSERTQYRGVRRLNQRHILRRERLHRVLNVLNFLPEHYSHSIDFNKRLGQFKNDQEPKLNYKTNEKNKHEFLFMDSFNKMLTEFKNNQPELFYQKSNGKETKIPHDWTIYYLRKKALSEKISREELAWVLLNFNQKRGYYQLRGEDEDEDKSKSFEKLKVRDVIDSGEKVKGNTLFNIVFDNNWEYDKQITKPEEWIGKTKEFIVTTKHNKDGSLKRTFKKVNSEEDWIAIKKKTEQIIDASEKTIGTYIFDELLKNPKQKINGKLIKTIERKYYKKELKKILSSQLNFHPELQNTSLYKACIEELYPRNEAHQNNIKDKDFEYLFVEDIIFYQRPLKSKKSTISNCQYEYREYLKKHSESGKLETIKEPLKAISKSNPLFLEFRLWQFLRNLKIYKIEDKKDIDITKQCLNNDEEWCDLFDFMNDRKEVDQKNIIDFFIKRKRLEKVNKENYRWNYVPDRKYPVNETRSEITSRLLKVENIDLNIFFNKKIEHQLWHIIYSVKDKNEYEKALKTFAEKHNLDCESFVNNFKKFPPFKSDYAAYSEKAIKKLLPLMRIGRYWDKNTIDDKVEKRITAIIERIDHMLVDDLEIIPEKNLKQAIALVSDDEIPARFIKSFIRFKNKNPLSGLNTYQACYATYERFAENASINKWQTPRDIDNYLSNFKQHSLRNPIVEQVVTETLRTVRDIWKFYGDSKQDFFNEIHVELGRDMKNPAKKRQAISEKNTINENTNQRIKAVLQELKTSYNKDIRPYSPSHQEILKIYEEGVSQNPNVSYLDINEDEILKIKKNTNPSQSEITRYKLWLEQGYISPYTGEIIPLNKLFGSDYQIEHIIPQSRYFDNSLNNKIICESAVNEDKSNRTAYEYLKSNGTATIDLGNGKNVQLFSLKDYEKHCSVYFKKNRAKLKNLLSEDVPEGFIHRQLNDSRYISKLVKGLLSNIVKKENEQEATSKNLVPVSGAITSKLKQDWGLNDKWNEIIAPRFKRLNKINKSEDYGYWDKKINAFRIQIPNDISKGFSKKRIDHRHHALDALIIACCTKDHINYITSLETERTNHALVSKLRHQEKVLKKNKKGIRVETTVARAYKLPWSSFPVDAKNSLDKTIISFKQNLRIINKTNNKTWQWVNKNGHLKKELVKQNKGQNWAIRKPLHTPMPYGKRKYNFVILDIYKNLGKRNLIIDDYIKTKIEDTLTLFNGKIGDTAKFLKKNPITDTSNNTIISTMFNLEEIRYRKRQPITKLANRGKGGIKKIEDAKKFINKISDKSIRNDLLNHLKCNENNIDKAFSLSGIETFNSNRKIPIYKLPISEASSLKFPLGEMSDTKIKFGEAESGTNLFFAIYWNKEKGTRIFETIPLYKVIEHQKWRATLNKNDRANTPIVPVDNEKGTFLFSLSPNDLVYIPTEDEADNPNLVDFTDLKKEQINRIYKMVSSTKSECHFIPNHTATEIKKNENGTNSKNERIQTSENSPELPDPNQKPVMIKSLCWKLKIDRLGNILFVHK